MKPGKIVKNGIIQVPEGRHVFPGLTVMQNLVVGTIAWRGLRKADIEETWKGHYAVSKAKRAL